MAPSKVLKILHVVAVLISLGEVTRSSRVSEVKNKLKDKLTNEFKDIKSKLDQNAEVSFEQPDREFPGNDAELVKEIRASWDKYYDCLNEQHKNLGEHKSITPEAIMMFEGSATILDCKACLSPLDVLNVDAVAWSFQALGDNDTKALEFTDRLYESPGGNNLHIFNLQLDDSGQYLCRIGETVTASYFLEVVDTKESVIVVKPDTAPHGLHKQPPIISNDVFNIFSTYYNWSQCNKCDQVGKRVRHGMCTVILKQNYPKYNAADADVEAARVESNVTITDEVVEDTRNILGVFERGIPCRSKLLPHDFRAQSAISGRKSELMVGFCKVSCRHSESFQVVDVDGNVIETANNTAGIYSTLQGIPPVPPAIQRRTMFEGSNQDEIVIKCPGNLNTETPVLWQIGQYKINPSLIKEQSHGRIHINVHEHLIIKRPRISDTNIYSCWQLNELAGTVRLNVFNAHEMNAGHQFVIFTMILVMGTFVIVFYRAFKGRKRQLAR